MALRQICLRAIDKDAAECILSGGGPLVARTRDRLPHQRNLALAELHVAVATAAAAETVEVFGIQREGANVIDPGRR